jgi:hypothetical protein
MVVVDGALNTNVGGGGPNDNCITCGGFVVVVVVVVVVTGSTAVPKVVTGTEIDVTAGVTIVTCTGGEATIKGWLTTDTGAPG